MWIRKIKRKWVNKSGDIVESYYYYWYKSLRKGKRVVSECVGRATEQEYMDYINNLID